MLSRGDCAAFDTLHPLLPGFQRVKQLLDYLKCTGSISSNSLPNEESYVEYVKWYLQLWKMTWPFTLLLKEKKWPVTCMHCRFKLSSLDFCQSYHTGKMASEKKQLMMNNQNKSIQEPAKPESVKEKATRETRETMRWIPAETSSTSRFVSTYFREQGLSTVGLDGNYVVDLST
ncbi:uncharacterized protein LJ206_003715 isoform 1-T1 [Theristicus caerulescens]